MGDACDMSRITFVKFPNTAVRYTNQCCSYASHRILEHRVIRQVQNLLLRKKAGIVPKSAEISKSALNVEDEGLEYFTSTKQRRCVFGFKMAMGFLSRK